MAATRTYEILSDEQKRVLYSFYENGMNSASKEMENMIQKAAEEAETTFEKVKVYKHSTAASNTVLRISVSIFIQ